MEQYVDLNTALRIPHYVRKNLEYMLEYIRKIARTYKRFTLVYLLYLHQETSLSVREVGDKMNLHTSTIRERISCLQKKNVVVSEKREGKIYVCLTEQVANMISILNGLLSFEDMKNLLYYSRSRTGIYLFYIMAQLDEYTWVPYFRYITETLEGSNGNLYELLIDLHKQGLLAVKRNDGTLYFRNVKDDSGIIYLKTYYDVLVKTFGDPVQQTFLKQGTEHTVSPREITQKCNISSINVNKLEYIRSIGAEMYCKQGLRDILKVVCDKHYFKISEIMRELGGDIDIGCYRCTRLQKKGLVHIYPEKKGRSIRLQHPLCSVKKWLHNIDKYEDRVESLKGVFQYKYVLSVLYLSSFKNVFQGQITQTLLEMYAPKKNNAPVSRAFTYLEKQNCIRRRICGNSRRYIELTEKGKEILNIILDIFAPVVDVSTLR